jgi:hypothetical protein
MPHALDEPKIRYRTSSNSLILPEKSEFFEIAAAVRAQNIRLQWFALLHVQTGPPWTRSAKEQRLSNQPLLFNGM